jgi:hypothetical protein
VTNPNFDIIASTTLDNYIPKLVENVFSARPFVHFLNQSGQIKTKSGGAQIVQPLMTGLNTTFGSYADYDVIDTTAQTGVTAANFPWRQLAISISVNGIEIAENSGDQQVVDLMETKIEQAEQTFLEKLDEMLITSDGTGNTNKDFFGLENVVNQNATSIGGIDPSTNTYWQSSISAPGDTALDVADMRTKMNDVSKGNDRPNIIMTTQTLYEEYEDLLAANVRYTNTELADAGFDNIVFKSVPMFYDEYVPAKHMYFLNTRYLHLVGHKDNWFRTTPFVKPPDQDAKFAQILCYGNLTTSSRERQGVLQDRIPAA